MNRPRIYPNPALRSKTCEVTNFDPAHINYVIKIMADSMKKYKAVGFAANQFGILEKIVLANVGKENIVVINPEIIESRGEFTEDEGCISFPGVEITITRPNYVVVRGLDENGESKIIEVGDLLARVLQHEIDHLNGILIVDKLSPTERLNFERLWKRGDYERKNPSSVL
ncbi:MAG: peptide deformylase [bacterium]